jgi:hypothetical protein
MVHEAEALEKPGKPTFFETPAWSFNMGVKFLLGGWGRNHGGAEFTATVKPPGFRYSGRKSDGRGCREAWAPPPHSTPAA